MNAFLLRRAIAGILSLLGATFIVFGITQMSEDPLNLYAKPGGYGVTPEQEEALRKKLGIDKPIPVQYVLWVGRALRGDLGNSILDELPVTSKIQQRIGITLKLGVLAWMLATVIGVPMGILAAVKRGSIWDYIGRIFALAGQAIPGFWLGIMMILLFAVTLGWLPSAGKGEGFISWRHMVMPVTVLGTATAAGYLRITRSAMLEVMDSEFVKLARAKGVSNNWVIWKHTLRNALIPPLTVSAVLMAGFITGSVITEQVFAIPGLGRLAIDAVNMKDFPVISGVTLLFVTIWVIMNFVTDILYVVIDPRIRLS